MRVGGNIDGGRMSRETWALQDGSIEYGGSCISSPRNTQAGAIPNARACGSLFVFASFNITKKALDRVPWEHMFIHLQIKSQYWYSLKPNGVFAASRAGPNSNTMVLFAGDNRCLQVFTLDRFDLADVANIELDRSLISKTILINVSPYGIDGKKGEVVVGNIGNFYDPWGGYNRQFSSTTKQSILWNFYCATKVRLGPATGVNFPGSISVPHGDLEMNWPGQDGRTIVRGNLVHNNIGSGFRNYEFDPSCPLTLPPTLRIHTSCG